MTYDRFDQFTLVAAAILLAGAGFYGMTGDKSPRGALARSSPASTPAICAELAKDRAIFEAGNNSKALERLKLFTASNPDIAEGHLLLGKTYAALEQYPPALKEYRQALVLDPEYADKSSEKFLGKTIKKVLQNGWAPCEVTAAPAKKTNDEAVLDDARYIQRMLAGGCE